MEDKYLDALISAFTQLFVLSLAVERVASIAKRWDVGMTGDDRKRIVEAKSQLDNAKAADEVLEVNRRVTGTTTFLIGVLLAFATQANAFTGLVKLPEHEVLNWIVFCGQIIMTGAAAGVGSSFWYDMLSLLIEIRKTKRQLAAAQNATVDQIANATAMGKLQLAQLVEEGTIDQPVVPANAG
jgi:hypothetical protein